MKIPKQIFLLSTVLLITFSCKKSKVNDLKADFKANYADIVYANYEDAYNDALALKTAIYALVDTPTDNNLSSARNAWLEARESYGQTEAFRFSNGPIDDEDGPEGNINAWPLDESYIDYVEGSSTSGIINNTSISIDATTLKSLNEQGGETNISLGYHAIEFLLWGQDDANTSLQTPGDRPYTDYVIGGTGTASNQDRRGAYLKACADILVEDLLSLVDEWKTGGSYRTIFLSEDDNESIKHILTGIGVLAKSELAGERIFTALDNQDQEDEHSCFSDNTHRDIILNFEGIYNIYKGEYSRTNSSLVSGTGFNDILEKQDKKLNEELNELFESCDAKVKAIPVPFDNALTQETPGGSGPINETVTALRNLGDKIAEAAAELGITIDTSLPE
ncbi:MAG: imelysin family protein [Crocinitomicaceae bacterium]